MPSSLVAALDHKLHLIPNTNTLPLNMVTIALQTKWKPDFSFALCLLLLLVSRFVIGYCTFQPELVDAPNTVKLKKI
jgi:hypothetical protein